MKIAIVVLRPVTNVLVLICFLLSSSDFIREQAQSDL